MQHKFDVYKFEIEQQSENSVVLQISNVISWELMTLKMTKKELSGLADFIHKSLENNNVLPTK
jgi:hypothetical protein